MAHTPENVVYWVMNTSVQVKDPSGEAKWIYACSILWRLSFAVKFGKWLIVFQGFDRSFNFDVNCLSLSQWQWHDVVLAIYSWVFDAFLKIVFLFSFFFWCQIVGRLETTKNSLRFNKLLPHENSISFISDRLEIWNAVWYDEQRGHLNSKPGM